MTSANGDHPADDRHGEQELRAERVADADDEVFELRHVLPEEDNSGRTEDERLFPPVVVLEVLRVGRHEGDDVDGERDHHRVRRGDRVAQPDQVEGRDTAEGEQPGDDERRRGDRRDSVQLGVVVHRPRERVRHQFITRTSHLSRWPSVSGLQG